MRDPGDIFRDLTALETERLVLRKMRLEDADDLFAFASDPVVAEHVSWYPHRTIEDSRAFLRATLGQYARAEVSGWGIELKAEGRLVGSAGFSYWLIPHSRAEIGYSLARRLWNQGLMTEAVRAIVDFGFERMGLNRIEARCKIANVASARVMEKVGMRFEGILREHQLAKGVYEDLKIYSILRREWPGPWRPSG